MDKTYLVAMIDSLEKKIEILNEIRIKDAEQYELTKKDPFPTEEFDKNSDEKGVLIYKLNKLDDGFQLVYDNIKKNLEENKAECAAEIKKMQELITRITELSVSIQAEEARNKAALENHFKMERQKIKGARSQSKAVKSYSQVMRTSVPGYSGIIDKKN